MKRSKTKKSILKFKEVMEIWIDVEESCRLGRNYLSNWAVSRAIEVISEWLKYRYSTYLNPKIFMKTPKSNYIILEVKHYYKVDFIVWTPKSYTRRMAYNLSLKSQFSTRTRPIEP